MLKADGREIHIAAAVLLDDRQRMLLVRKRGSRYFMQPGGKIEAGENPVEALRRELDEEVALGLGQPSPHGVFRAAAANEPGATVVAHVFSGRAAGSPSIGREIEAMVWLDPAAPTDIPLAPLTREHMLPLAGRLAQTRGEP